MAHATWLVQLERLDAPAAVLDACGAAMDDAIDHAESASRLAYALLGREEMVAPEPDWPSPVDVPDVDGVRLAVAIARHGCIESTLLAAHVRAALRAASDPTVGAVLRRLARGADRRAAFAWRTLDWLLHSVVADGSRAILLSALDALYREVAAVHRSGSDPATPPRVGRLGSAERARIAATILERVVAPRFAAWR